MTKDKFKWEPGDVRGYARRHYFDAADAAEHERHRAEYVAGETWDDCPICWVDMTPSRFLRHHLQGVADLTLLARDETSWLMGVTFDNGRRVMAVVYDPSVHGVWEVELGDEVLGEFTAERPATTWSQEDGCVDESELPSPIERILERQRDAETNTKGDER